jgi:hypothetical protein
MAKLEEKTGEPINKNKLKIGKYSEDKLVVIPAIRVVLAPGQDPKVDYTY